MDSTKQFLEGIQKFNQNAERLATRRLRRISLKALSMIVVSTPVLTGCCRANWQVSHKDLQRVFDAKKADKSGGNTINVGAAQISSAELGVDVFIENSCPYVLRLENGWSRQGPPGCMVRNNYAKLSAAIENGAE